MRRTLRRVLHAVAPRLGVAISSARGRAHFHRLVELWGARAVGDALIARFGTRVQEGPFAGLQLTPSTHADHLGPYLLGVYESELHAVWDDVLGRGLPQIVDIGAKFGYYAVGFARRCPSADVIAFDTDWWARRAIREMAHANGTPNVAVRGFCDRAWLESQVREGALVISDCEGYEETLFGAGARGAIARATLVIETHDDIAPGVTARLRERLGATHAITTIASTTAGRRSSRDLSFLPEDRRRLALFEIRPQQYWLVCRPPSAQG